MSPLTLADGPPGLEATHEWELLGRALNDVVGTLPRYKLTKITGYNSLGEIEDLRDVNTGRVGETAYPSVMRGKTITYEGVVEAQSYEQLRSLSSALRGAFADTWAEHRMVVNPYTGWGSQQFAFWARTMALDMDEEQTFAGTAVPSPWQRAFTLSVRMSDPRRYAWPTPVDAVAGTSQVVTNLGTAPSDPVITLTGITDPSDVWVRNLTIGTELFFRELPVTADVVIDFHNRKITQAGYPNDQSGLLLPSSSDWWNEGVPGIAPGDNQITAHFGQYVTFYHAFW